MSREEKRAGGQGPIVIATAALTVAVAVTAGAMTGYLHAPAAEPAAVPDAPMTEAAMSGPQVVLVPMRPEAPLVAPDDAVPSADEPLVRTALWTGDDGEHEEDEEDEEDHDDHDDAADERDGDERGHDDDD